MEGPNVETSALSEWYKKDLKKLRPTQLYELAIKHNIEDGKIVEMVIEAMSSAAQNERSKKSREEKKRERQEKSFPELHDLETAVINKMIKADLQDVFVFHKLDLPADKSLEGLRKALLKKRTNARVRQRRLLTRKDSPPTKPPPPPPSPKKPRPYGGGSIDSMK